MDPNNPPPRPDQPPPDQPPAGPAGAPPQWGAPPPAAGPAGAPPQWGTPPPPAGPAGAPPQWGVAAAPARRGIPRPLIVGGVVALLIIVGVVFAVLRFGNADAGKVVFTTDQPTQIGAQTCEVGTRVTTVKVGTPVYAIYFLSHRLAATDTVNLEVLKDGTSINSGTVPSNQTSDADCVETLADVSTSLNQPGTYEIRLTVGGETVSDGTLTITP